MTYDRTDCLNCARPPCVTPFFLDHQLAMRWRSSLAVRILPSSRREWVDGAQTTYSMTEGMDGYSTAQVLYRLQVIIPKDCASGNSLSHLRHVSWASACCMVVHSSRTTKAPPVHKSCQRCRGIFLRHHHTNSFSRS
jgi:hypothetical protein